MKYKKSLIVSVTAGLLFSLTPVLAASVGMAFDAGGKLDKSFNQSAYDGAQRAVKSLGVTETDYEPANPKDVIIGITQSAKLKADLTIGVGFNNVDPISTVAKANPNLHFAVIDNVSDQPNVASLTFHEEEGSFLVGYLAGLNTTTNVIGFLGGLPIPLIYKFAAGFKAGVHAANPSAKVVSLYVGTTAAAWDNKPQAMKQAALLQKQGADIIYTAAGNSGGGVIAYVKANPCLKAANLPSGVTFHNNNFAKVPKSPAYIQKCSGNTRPAFFIGVDSNQNYLGDDDGNPSTLNYGLTSMVKRVDNAVYAVLNSVVNKTFKGGEQSFGLKDDGVGFAMDRYNRALIPGSQVALAAQQQQKIIQGVIKVPTK